MVFSYNRPIIESISPSRVFTGEGTYDFVISGANLASPLDSTLGFDAVQPTAVRVGGKACLAGVVVISPFELRCNGVSAQSWPTTSVEVTLQG